MEEISRWSLVKKRLAAFALAYESANREVNHWPEVAQLVSSRAQSRPALCPQHNSEGAADLLPCPLPGQSKPEAPFLLLHMIDAGIKCKCLWFFPVKHPFSLLSFEISS